jgi:hypothetical protein
MSNRKRNDRKKFIITCIKALSKVKHHVTQAGGDGDGEAPRIVKAASNCRC